MPGSNVVIATDRDTLHSTIADVVREAMLDHVPKALEEAQKPEWLHRDAVKERYGLTDRQLQYLRNNNRITYSQHGRRIWYQTESVESYFAEGRVDAQRENPSQCSSTGRG